MFFMARTRSGSPVLVYALVLALVAPVLSFGPAPGIQAQGSSKTFPETGKTVSGKFLQYWNNNGGLTQQGYPLSEQIQERSETDGKIYTVQYFERAVFEHHPENAGKPSEVLLQLLGSFLHIQKYAQGVPGAVPNNEPGSMRFAETGRRLGGKFLTYWQTHGGLAQQGFPISDEFMEKSDLDGKTYRVQYFERAVFELHPENRPPFDVLLSQLGTFRYRAKYGALAHQLTGGGGDQKTNPFALKGGLTVVQSVRAGAEGSYYINLINEQGDAEATVAAGSGPLEQSHLIPLSADGMYMLDLYSDGDWTVNIWQPKASYAPPPAVQSWKGYSWQATPLFSLKAGPASFRVTGKGSTEALLVSLNDQNGEWVADIANSPGGADSSKTIEVPADGVYIAQIIYEGDWTLEVRQ